MPDDWVHCLFTGSVIGVKYEGKHCWVHSLLDHPAKYLGDKHRILLHDLETAVKLSKVCWWAGFVAALHIDLDEICRKDKEIKVLLKKIVHPIKKKSKPVPKQVEKLVRNTGLVNPLSEAAIRKVNKHLRTLFEEVHEKVGLKIYTWKHKEAFIYIKPETSFKLVLNYVNRVPPPITVNGFTFDKAPPTIPRIIPHPCLFEKPRKEKNCFDLKLLKHLFDAP